jgi:hypothetical protein
VAKAGSVARVEVSKVRVSERPTERGTLVTARYTLTNKKARATPPRRIKLFLVGADGVRQGLPGSTAVPSLPAGASRTFTTARLVGPRIAEGNYFTRVCYTRRPEAPCATTATASVKITPAVLELSDDVLVVPFTAPAQGRAVTDMVRVLVTNTGQAQSGPLSFNLQAVSPPTARGAEHRAPSTAFTVGASTCEASLAPGQRCRIDIARTADSNPAATAVLAVRGARGAVARGYVVGPVRAVPVLTDFGDVKSFTTSEPRVISLVNQTDGDVGVSFGFVDSRSFSFDFGAPEFTCDDGAPVPAGGSCSVVVRFAPTEVGAQIASGTLFTTVGSADFFLAGTGLPGEAPTQSRTPRQAWGAAH